MPLHDFNMTTALARVANLSNYGQSKPVAFWTNTTKLRVCKEYPFKQFVEKIGRQLKQYPTLKPKF
jgi:hypothetical protein